ncbi:MAG: hypothetical protein CMH57_04165 [Myxococcales bacterium]|nr:hypothetical protein [Myxococcales bacterium]
MNTSTRPLLLLFAAGAPLWATACVPNTPSNATPSSEATPRPASTFTVPMANASADVTYPAQAEALATVELALRVGGPLVDLPIKEGDIVQEGDTLARVDPRDYQVQVRALRSQAAAARAQRNKARLDLERAQKLVATHAVPEAQLDATQAGFQIATAQLAQVTRSVEAARLSLQDTTLGAPFSGRVARVLVENHQTVAPGQPILRLQDTRRVMVRLNVPERDMLALTNEPDPKLSVRFSAHGGESFPAEVREYGTDINPDTRTYELALTVDTGDLAILPGMTATVTWERTRRATPVIPLATLTTTSDGRSMVWRVSPKNTLSRVVVEVGQVQNDGVEIVAGLRPGDTLLAAGLSSASEGLEIVPRGDAINLFGGAR